LALERKWEFYDIRQHTAFCEPLQLRICRSGEIIGECVLGREDEVDRVMLMDRLVEQFPQITSLLYTINTKMTDSLYDLEPIIYKRQWIRNRNPGRFSV
jgi:23S rRNA (uracil1939-C5)-methyltransferase